MSRSTLHGKKNNMLNFIWLENFNLIKKITKNELIYEELMGKPYLVTYEYAAEQIQRLSKNGNRINKFYIIGYFKKLNILIII